MGVNSTMPDDVLVLIIGSRVRTVDRGAGQNRES
jgi:hypothetical protein